jgi:hypothetical protein
MKITNHKLKQIIKEEMDSLYREAEEAYPVGITQSHLKKQSAFERIQEARALIDLALKEIKGEFATKQHPDTDEETFQSTNKGNKELISILSEVKILLNQAPGLEVGKGY